MKIASTALLALAASLGFCSSVDASPLQKRGNCYDGSKRTTLTNYWLPDQGQTDMNNNGGIVHLSGPKNKALRDASGHTIAMVDINTWNKCRMEGTCIIHNNGQDIVVNLATDGGSDARFEVLNKKKTPFGIGSDGNPLRPFVSVAVNDLPRGTTLYVKELDGMMLPNGVAHNGCVAVDDNGWSFGGCQLDFFVLKYAYYQKLQTPSKVSVSKKNCKVLNYTTKQDYGYVGVKPSGGAPPGNGDGNGNGGGHAGPRHKHSSQSTPTKTKGSNRKGGSAPSPTPSTPAVLCGSASVFAETFSETNLAGTASCAAGSGCHKLPGDGATAVKSAKWSSGTSITLFASTDCSGETLYVDSEGEDTDLSGDGNGFKAGSILIQ